MKEINHKLTKLKQKLVINKNKLEKLGYDCRSLNRLIDYKNQKIN